ncbi:MAG: lipid-A-disaccharide synthase [Planctomycetia bacterium]|nr:lipid-A-disaccharide synthase [Planctomycetia bacterium]
MKVFFSVGEPSGDVHGANLIREMKAIDPDTECVGFGGSKMAQAGCDIHFDLTTLAIMWIGGALQNLRQFFRLADQAEEYFRTQKPDAVVLIDYPGFNWHIAKRAKKYGVPVYYYSPPQVWAWASHRVKKLRERTDCVFSGLPFETDWLRERGVRVEYVGHPFFDETKHHPLPDAQWEAQRPLVGILPGSRTQEVKLNFPLFLKAMRKIQKQVPPVHFAIAAYRPQHAQMIEELLQKADDISNANVFVQRTPEIIQAAECCVSVSGSVSLELLYHEKPTVILYKISRLAWWIQWLFRRSKYITLVNLLVAKEAFRSRNPEFRPGSADAREAIFPEYLVCRDRSDWIARDIVEWLTSPDALNERRERLRALKAEVAQSGAAKRAAQIILAHRQRSRENS